MVMSYFGRVAARCDRGSKCFLSQLRAEQTDIPPLLLEKTGLLQGEGSTALTFEYDLH